MTKMNCTEIAELLTAHHDGALSSGEHRAVEAHLDTCPSCSADLAAIAATSALVRKVGTHTVPADFAPLALLDAAAGEPRYRPLRLVASHAAAAAVGALMVFAALYAQAPGHGLLQEAIDTHSRAMANHSEIQVASGDTHTVRPWLSAHVPFSPPVHNVLAGGATLIGGRIDTLAGRPTAVLVYELRRHRIAIFIQPREGGRLPSSLDAARHGFNLIGWQRGDFTYLAVSDVNAPELRAATAGLLEE